MINLDEGGFPGDVRHSNYLLEGELEFAQHKKLALQAWEMIEASQGLEK